VFIAVTNNSDHNIDSLSVGCTALSDSGEPSDIGYANIEKLDLGETANSDAIVEAPDGTTVDNVTCRVDVALP
jgi:hypothetical protein